MPSWWVLQKWGSGLGLVRRLGWLDKTGNGFPISLFSFPTHFLGDSINLVGGQGLFVFFPFSFPLWSPVYKLQTPQSGNLYYLDALVICFTGIILPLLFKSSIPSKANIRLLSSELRVNARKRLVAENNRDERIRVKTSCSVLVSGRSFTSISGACCSKVYSTNATGVTTILFSLVIFPSIFLWTFPPLFLRPPPSAGVERSQLFGLESAERTAFSVIAGAN